MVGPAAVRALAAINESEEAVNTVSPTIYHQVQTLRLNGIADRLKIVVLNSFLFYTWVNGSFIRTMMSTMIVERFLRSEEFEIVYNFMSSSKTNMETL